MLEELNGVTQEDWVRGVVRDELAALVLTALPLAGQIRQARKEAGLTQHELAEWLGVSQATIHLTEDGARRLLPRQLEEYVAALGKRIVLVDLRQEAPDARD